MEVGEEDGLEVVVGRVRGEEDAGEGGADGGVRGVGGGG